MTRLAMALVTVASIVFGFKTAAWPQEFDVGKYEYQLGCAACHGIDGKGGGPVSSAVKVAPSDLTVLAKRNNGVFPFQSVYEVIEGQKVVIAHGTRQMPIWGNRFIPDVKSAANEWVRIIRRDKFVHPSFDIETIVRMRILAVIDYLNRIQDR